MAPGTYDVWDFIPVIFATILDLVVRVSGIFALPLLIALILSIILGLNIQRDTIANLHLINRHQSNRYIRLLFPAFLFALGWEVGFLIVPLNPINPFQLLVGFTSDNGPFLRILTMVAILLPLLACLIWIWFTFARYVTVRFMGSYPGDRHPTFISYLIIFALCPLLLQYFPLMVLFTLLLSDPMSDIYGGLFPDQQALFTLVVAAVAIMFSANLIIDGLAFGCSWLFGEIWFRLRKRFCPACGTMIQKRLVVGRKCDHCNAELAVWPFVKH
jgi:hypothetical protein